MPRYGTRTVERLFGRTEFLALFERAASRCVQNARRFYCDGELPTALLFYCPMVDARADEQPEKQLLRVPAETLRDLEDALPLLLRKDGFHRPEVRLHPVGMTDDATVVQLDLPHGPKEWSNELLAGEFAVPEEPFVLRGPALEKDGEKPAVDIPRVRLPRVEALPDDFDWLLAGTECDGLTQQDPAERLACAERLTRRLEHGFEPGDLAERIAEAAENEENALVKRGFASLLEARALPSWLLIRRSWLHDRDALLRASAYQAAAQSRSVKTFELLLSCVATERSERGQVGLVRALGTCVGTNGDRYTRLNAATQGVPLTKAARRELARIASHFIA